MQRLSLEGRGAFIVSDLHLGLEPPLGFPNDLEAVLAAALSSAARRGDVLILDGDILDAGARARDATEILRRHPRIEDALRLACEQSEVFYVAGNHDPPRHELVAALPWTICDALLVDDSTLIVHGDGFDEGLHGTFVGQLGDALLGAQRFAGVSIEAPARVQASPATRLVGGIALEAALAASRLSRSPELLRFVDENMNYLVSMEEQRDPRFVVRALARASLPAGVRTVICGHTHHPGIARIDELTYVNAGTWSKRLATAVFLKGGTNEVRDVVTGRVFGEEAYAGHETPSEWREFAETDGRASRLAPVMREAISAVAGRASTIASAASRGTSEVFATLPWRGAGHHGSGDGFASRPLAYDGESRPRGLRFSEHLSGTLRRFEDPRPERALAVDLDLEGFLAAGERPLSATLAGRGKLEGLTEGVLSGTLHIELSGGGSLAYHVELAGEDGCVYQIDGRKVVRFSELGRSLTEFAAAVRRDGEPWAEAELVFDARRDIGTFVRSLAVEPAKVRTVARHPAAWAPFSRAPIARVAAADALRVAVTGAAGHLGHNLVAQLLERGHRVTAIVRRARDNERTAPLRALTARRAETSVGGGSLSIAEADLVSPAAATRVLGSGFDVVIHAASVYALVATDGERTVVEPTVDMAVNVVRAAARGGTRRVVLTSSLATLGNGAEGRDALDEADWDTNAKLPYHRAKTLAERRARAVAEAEDVELVAINAAAFLGPNFFRHTPSTQALADLAFGRMPVALPLAFTWADVRDIAWAHVLAAENASASGRYVVATSYMSMAELARRMLAIDPHLAVPTRVMPASLARFVPAVDWARSALFGMARAATRDFIHDVAGKELRVSSARARRELGWEPGPIDVTIADTLRWLEEQYER